MPTYNYVCDDCQHTFEKFLKMSERLSPTEQPCPSCNSLSVRQGVNLVAVGDPVAIGSMKVPKKFKEGVLSNVAKMPGVKKKDSKFD